MSDDSLGALTAAAQELITKINDLNEDTGNAITNVTKQSNTTRKYVWWLAFSFALDLILTVAMLFVVNGQQTNADRIAVLTEHNSVTQTITRQQVLCPLYQLFLDSRQYQPPPPDPEARARQEAAYKTIQAGYDAIKCAEVKPK